MTVRTILQDGRYTYRGVNFQSVPLRGPYYSFNASGGDSVPFDPNNLIDHAYQLTKIDVNAGVVLLYDTVTKQLSYIAADCQEFTHEQKWDSNDELKLFCKLQRKWQSQDFNGSNFLVEAHQPLRMLRDTVVRLRVFFEALHRGNIYKAAVSLHDPDKPYDKRLKTRFKKENSRVYKDLKTALGTKNLSSDLLASAVLEVQYGWRPLLSDAAAAAESLASIYHRVPKSTYKVRRKRTEIADQNIGSAILCKKQGSVAVQYLVEILGQPSTSDLLHLNDPLGALWEFTPWSFVADWFIPISDWLQTVNFQREVSISRFIRSEKSSNLSQCFPVNFGNTQSTMIVPSTLKVFQFSRTFPSTSTIADLPLPAFKPMSKALSPEHVLNAIALLTTSVNRFR